MTTRIFPLTWPEVEVIPHDLGELLVALGRGAVVHDGDGEGLGNADGVRHLDEAPPAEAGLHQGLGDPAGGVGGAAINLRTEGCHVKDLIRLQFINVSW